MSSEIKPRITGILLAAGESRRMGAVNKLLLPVQGRALVRRTAEVLLASRLCELTVVIGFQADLVREALAGLALDVVVNPDYAGGRMSSAHRGLQALGGDCDAFMVVLADQPKLAVADIDRLIDGWLALGPGSVLVPTHGGQRGNPVVIAGEHRAAILGSGPALGCRHFIETHPELISRVEMDTDHVVADLDSPADYRRFAPADV